MLTLIVLENLRSGNGTSLPCLLVKAMLYVPIMEMQYGTSL